MIKVNKGLELFNILNNRNNKNTCLHIVINKIANYFKVSAPSCEAFIKNITLAQEIRGYDVNIKRVFGFIPFLFIILFKNFFRKKNVVSADIVFDNSNKRWSEVNDIVSNELKNLDIYKYTNKYYDIKTIIRILFFLVKNFYLIILLVFISIKYKVNYIAHFHRLLLEILENTSILKHIRSSVYFTSNIDTCTFIKKEQFNKAGVKIFLLQTVAIDYYISSYIAANIFFAFGKNQIDIALRVGSEFDEVYTVGSLKSIEKSKKTAKKYNITFVEQVANFDKINYTSNAEYNNLVNNMIKFSEEYSEINIAFLSRIQDRYSTHDEIINKYFKKLYEDLDTSDIEIIYLDNNYPLVKQSDIVVSYCSTLCLEAVGLDSIPLFCFNNSVQNYELLYNIEEECILFESSYASFKTRVLEMLSIDKKIKIDLIRKMKKNHMNTSEKSLYTVISSIENSLNIRKGKRRCH